MSLEESRNAEEAPGQSITRRGKSGLSRGKLSWSYIGVNRNQTFIPTSLRVKPQSDYADLARRLAPT